MEQGPLEHLIKMLSTLPGVGRRSARRIALHLLTKRESSMRPLAQALENAANDIKTCTQCGNLDMCNPCTICASPKRDRSKICVVAQVNDLWAIERTGFYKGLYHILGGVLSALDGISPHDLRINSLMKRLEDDTYDEIILALSATVDGQSTAHYVSDQIHKTAQDHKIPTPQITRLAHGVPVGGELDYLDQGTIITALNARRG